MLIILIVFFPILTLTGIEGKYFTPMAKTLVFCIIGALLLSVTYVPMMASLFLKRTVTVKPTLADRFFDGLNKVYGRILRFSLSHVWGTITASFVALLLSLLLFTKLGAEFIPTLDEGDFAMQMTLPAGSSLSRSIELSLAAEKRLKESFPEIKHVVAKIGTTEVPTDPMAVEDADVMIVMELLQRQVPPMAVQMLVENAVKHNEISNRNPLTIRIHAEGNGLCVSNRIQPKLTDNSSTCIGLANLSKRYRLLFGQDITIEENEKLFKATLPLI